MSRSAQVGFVLRHLRLTCGLCSLQEHTTGYRLERRHNSDTNLFHVLAGRLRVEIEGTAAVGDPGDLFVIPRGATHAAASVGPDIRFLSVHVSAAVGEGRDAFELLQPAQHRPTDPAGRLRHYCEGAAEEFSREDPAQTRQALSAWAQLITLELIREDDEAGRLSPRAMDPVVAMMLDELEGHVGEAVTLEDLAARAGYSQQHLNRRFRRALGVTPLGHLRHLRMERAATLLAEGVLEVRAVAQRVGYTDPFYFSRAFKQALGRSPSDYRAWACSDSPSRPP